MSLSNNRSSRRTRIAVAGATGRVGAALTAGLADEPVDIVALTRNPGALKPTPNVAVAAVNFDDDATLREALRGVDRLFISHGTSSHQVRNEIALIDAAVACGVNHIVKLSVLGPPSRLHPFDWHMRIEAHLAAQNVGFTVLRPSPFNDILRRAAAQVAKGTWSGSAGQGRANFIDTRDVADAARVILLDERARTSQRAFHLTGPRAWTMQEIAAELAAILGKAVSYTELTQDQHRSALTAAGASDFVAELLLGLDEQFNESALAETTSTVQDLTGHAPRPLPRWLAENLPLFEG